MNKIRQNLSFPFLSSGLGISVSNVGLREIFAPADETAHSSIIQPIVAVCTIECFSVG